MWHINMLTTLQVDDVWENFMFGFLEPRDEIEEQTLIDAEREQWRKEKNKNAQELHLIQQGVNQTMF